MTYSLRTGVSKLMMVIYTTELQRRLSAKSIPITCISLQPGSVDTGWAWRTPYPRLAAIAFKLFFIKPDQGAYTSCFAAHPLLSKRIRQIQRAVHQTCGEDRGKEPERCQGWLAEELWETTEKFWRGWACTSPWSGGCRVSTRTYSD